MKPSQKYSFLDDIALIVLATLSIVLLIFELATQPSPEVITLIRSIDIGIAIVFLGEFFWRLKTTQDKKLFWKENWWQLFASIPVTTSGTQMLRGLMLLRLFRVMRFTSLFVRLNLFSRSLSRFMKETRLSIIITTLGTILLGSTFIIHHFESAVNPHIETLFDSFYLASSAMTNTGIGISNIEPITREAQITMIFLVFSGVIIFGLFVAFFSSYLVSTRNKRDL